MRRRDVPTTWVCGALVAASLLLLVGMTNRAGAAQSHATQDVTVTIVGPSESPTPAASAPPQLRKGGVRDGVRAGAQVLGGVIRRVIPHTGAEIARLTVVGLLLVGVGTVMIVLARRRRLQSRRNQLTSA